jgi:SMI1 / KNR4 family (SUKH-1)
MSVRWHRPSDGASEVDLCALEARLEAQLPSDYRQFLLAHNGGEPETNEFSIPGTSNASGVNAFMSVSEICEHLDRYGDRFPMGVVPIAFAEGGNLVLLEVDNGRVLFWDHELEGADPIFNLASSFDDFWQQLRDFDPTTVVLKPGQVKSVWVDPDLLK